jgi:hypothetical protein
MDLQPQNNLIKYTEDKEDGVTMYMFVIPITTKPKSINFSSSISYRKWKGKKTFLIFFPEEKKSNWNENTVFSDIVFK